jgi:hypothetical protein
VGLVVFGVGAAFLSEVALAGIILAGFGAVAYTWFSLGTRAVIVGLGGAMVGGVIAWIGMRWMMRWVALSSGLPLTLTLEGTLAILGTSLIMSVPAAMGYAHFRGKFGSSFVKSLIYGVVISLVGGIPLLILLLGEISSTAREPVIPASFLLGVPLVYAPVLEATHRLLRNRQARW